MEKNDKAVEVQTKKKGLTKNKIVAIVVACVLVVGAVIGIVLGVVLGKKPIDLDKMYVVGYENLKTIGVGSDGSASNVAYAASDSDDDREQYRIVGVKSDDSVEPLKFSKEKDGDGVSVDLYVNYFLPLNNFTLIGFCDYPVYKKNFNSELSLYKNETNVSYILDNKMGRMYNLKNLNLNGATVFMDYENGEGYFDHARYTDIESKNSLYLPIKISGDSGQLLIYRLTMDGEELKAEEVVNQSSVTFCEYFMVDNYDNLFLKTDVSSDAYTNLVNSKNTVVSLGDGKRLYRGLNGFVYNKDDGTKFNADSEEENSQDKAEDIYLSKFNLVKKEGNSEYYYGYDKMLGITSTSWASYTPDMNTIYKLDMDDNGVDYTVTKIPIKSISFTEPSDYEYAANGTKIYLLSANTIIAVDILSGDSTNIDAQDYVFRTIYSDNLGNVVFRGVHGNENVVGVINPDGTIGSYAQQNDYRLVYIAPTMD